MRALNPKFVLFDTAQVVAGGWSEGNAAGFEIARPTETRAGVKKHKNRGNEPKEYLKTKDITFLNAANYAHLTRQFAPIEH